MTSRARMPGWVALVLALAAAPPVRAAEQDPLCAEAIAAGAGEPLRALGEAEQAEWRVIRHAGRQIEALAKSTQGLGESPNSLRSIERIEELYRTIDGAMQRARSLCFCRQLRGDPNREDCARLYDGRRTGGRSL